MPVANSVVSLQLVHAVDPPSTGKAAPVTKETSSDKRNNAGLAISSGLSGLAALRARPETTESRLSRLEKKWLRGFPEGVGQPSIIGGIGSAQQRAAGPALSGDGGGSE